MNDLIRPSLYDAWHDIVPLAQPAPDAALHPVDVVGPICESSDTFARQRPLPPVAEGDLLAFSTAGAYSFAMASTYNSRPLAPEVMRSEEHTSDLQSLMRISYAVFCLQKKKTITDNTTQKQ